MHAWHNQVRSGGSFHVDCGWSRKLVGPKRVLVVALSLG